MDKKIEWIQFDKTVVDITNLVAEGFWIKERLDDRLDEAYIEIPSWDRDIEIDMLSQIRITIDGKVFNFLHIGSDVTNLSNSLTKFKHEIRLGELTKYHEKLIVGNKVFSRNKNGSARFSVYSAINTLFNVVKNKYNLNSTWDVFDQETKTRWQNTELPELQITNVNLREGINIILSILGVTYELLPSPENENKQIIKEVKFNNKLDDLGNNLNDLKAYSYLRATDSEYLANDIESNISNVLVDEKKYTPFPTATNKSLDPNNPNRTFFAIGKSFVSDSDGVIGENTITFKIPDKSKIGEITGIWWHHPSVKLGDPSDTNLYAVSFNITDWVVTKEEYDSLPSQKIGSKYPASKTNRLFYSIDGNYIDGWNKDWGAWGTGRTYANILRILTGNNSETSNDTWNNNSSVTIKYKPKIPNISISIPKIKTNSTLVSSIESNQSDTNVNSLEVSKNLSGQINRVGNPEVTINKIIKDVNDWVKLGDYYQDRIVSEIESVVMLNQIVQRITLVEDFNKLSDFIGIESRRRQFEIPINNTLPVTIIRNTYVLFKKDKAEEKETFLTSQGRKSLVSGIVGTLSNIDGIRGFVQELLTDPNPNFIYYYPAFPPGKLELFQGSLNLALTNSASFIINYKDNITADICFGTDGTNSETIPMNNPINYADENGDWNTEKDIKFISNVEFDGIISSGNIGYIEDLNGFLLRAGKINETIDVIMLAFVFGQEIEVNFRYTLTSSNVVNNTPVITSFPGVDYVIRIISITNDKDEDITTTHYYDNATNSVFSRKGEVRGDDSIFVSAALDVPKRLPLIDNKYFKQNNIHISDKLNPLKDRGEELSINYQINFISEVSENYKILICEGMTLENSFISDVELENKQLFIYTSETKIDEFSKNILPSDAKFVGFAVLDNLLDRINFNSVKSKTIIFKRDGGKILFVIDNISEDVWTSVSLEFSNQRKGIIYDW